MTEAARLLDSYEPRPVRDDQPCQRCRHPRWMHAPGRPANSCHFTNYGGDARNRCDCGEFVEEQL